MTITQILDEADRAWEAAQLSNGAPDDLDALTHWEAQAARLRPRKEEDR